MSELKRCGNCAFCEYEPTRMVSWCNVISPGASVRDENMTRPESWCGSWQPKSWRELPTTAEEFVARQNRAQQNIYSAPFDCSEASEGEPLFLKALAFLPDMIEKVMRRVMGEKPAPQSVQEITVAECFAKIREDKATTNPNWYRSFAEAERMVRERGYKTIDVVSALIDLCYAVDLENRVREEEEELKKS